MSTYNYSVRSTGRPFGPCERLTDADYANEVSRHTSLDAAERARSRLVADMREHCGYGAWDNHYEVFALRDQTITYTLRCNGPAVHGHYGCPNGIALTLVLDWPAGTTRPALPDAIEGWDSSWQCSDCRATADSYNDEL
jgi:hypothetical protein